MSTAPIWTGHPLAARMPSDSVTSLTRSMRAAGQSSRCIAALREGRKRRPSTVWLSGTVAGGGHEWSFVSLNLGFPARSLSSVTEYGSHRMGQNGTCECSTAQPSVTPACSRDAASVAYRNPP